MAESGGCLARHDRVHFVGARDLRVIRGGRMLLDLPAIRLGDTGCSVIVGPNGAGKSLLIQVLCGLLAADAGSVHWANSPPDQSRRQRVGMLLQHPVLLRRSALQNVAFALRHAGLSRRKAYRQARESLESAGLAAIMDVPAQRLSGGEQQRVALARALVLKPDMLFLDEATAHVDPASTLVIEHQLLGAMRSGLRLVMVSHDMGQVRRLAEEVVLMHQGRLVEQNAKDKFFNHPDHSLTRRWIVGELLV